jgi:predicted O-methyltransferase YrrM
MEEPSSEWHSNVIASLGRAYRTARGDDELVSYLEVGLWDGATLWEVAKAIQPNGRAYGVDVDLAALRRRHLAKSLNVELCEMPSDQFFADHRALRRVFDLIFIDGLHTADQAQRDLANAVKMLKQDGTIVMHDTYPMRKEWTDESVCGDVYKVVPKISQERFQVATLPLFPGLTFVVKGRPRVRLS